MKTWRVPVVWQETAMIDIVANTLREAVELAKDKDGVIPIPDDGVYVDETWGVDCADNIEFIRAEYNNGQPDDISTIMYNDVEYKPVMYAEWLPSNLCVIGFPTHYCSHCKADVPSKESLRYKFCPGCGYEMKVKKENV